MARIRTIKPEFWIDEKIVELSPWARLLFIGMWNFADDQGFVEYKPKRLKMQIFPAEAIDVDPLLGELIEQGIVQPYQSPIGPVLHIVNWTRHQRVEKPGKERFDRSALRAYAPPRPTGSGASENPPGGFPESAGTAPDPAPATEHSSSSDSAPPPVDDQDGTPDLGIRGGLPESSPTPPEPSPAERKGKEGKGREQESARARETTPQPPAPRPAAPPPLDQLPAHPLDDFTLTDAMRRYAANTFPGLDVDFETAQFIAHHRAVGSKRKSWSDAWQKWLRDSAQRAAQNRTGGAARTTGLSRNAQNIAAARQRAIAAEIQMGLRPPTLQGELTS